MTRLLRKRLLLNILLRVNRLFLWLKILSIIKMSILIIIAFMIKWVIIWTAKSVVLLMNILEILYCSIIFLLMNMVLAILSKIRLVKLSWFLSDLSRYYGLLKVIYSRFSFLFNILLSTIILMLKAFRTHLKLCFKLRKKIIIIHGKYAVWYLKICIS
jgi:hypothetical protein